MKRILFLIVLFSIQVQSQEFKSNLKDNSLSLTLSPYSHKAWGTLKGVSDVTVQYRGVFVTYLHNSRTRSIRNFVEHKDLVGLGFNPISFNFSPVLIEGGFIYFNKKLPSKHYGAHFNFNLVLNVRIYRKLYLQYKHISNGFKIFQDYNPGVDNIGLMIKL